MSFMQPEIIQGWFDILETNEGTRIYPHGILNQEEIIKLINIKYIHTIELAIEECMYEKKFGWFGRLSAPGFLDATDWNGPYKTPEETEKELDNIYGNDLE